MHKTLQTAARLKNSEKGFALIAAIMACLILLALGMLVISLSTQDIRISTKIVGEKRALAAVEEGVQRLLQAFDPQSPINSLSTITRADGKSSYTINYPVSRPTTGPDAILLVGYQIAGGQAWGLKRYTIGVVGTNTEYNTQVSVGVGFGYGPIEISTMYR
jgi:Tfp pilus assembly protein PilX